MAAKRVEITFDQNRAVLVFRRIIEAWQARELKLKGIVPAEIQILDLLQDLTLVHQSWILYLVGTLSLSHQKTRTLTKNIIVLLETKPWSTNANLEDPLRLAEFVFYEGWKLHQHRTDLETFWLESKKRFRDTDPRQIFIDYGSNQDALIHELDSIYGIGLKIAHLLTTYFQHWAYDSNTQLYKDWAGIGRIKAVPIDSHWYKLLRQTGIVTKWNSQYHNSVIRPCTDFACTTCQAYQLSSIDLVQGTWHIFSNICAFKPTDPDKQAVYCYNNCPLESCCDRIVRPTNAEIKVGIVGWKSATKRTKIQDLSL
jgi:hypothetical protein